MKRIVAASFLLFVGCAAVAQEATNNLKAKIDSLYVEPGTADITLVLQDAVNPCGGINFYRLYKTNPIYKQLYGLLLAAIATDKPVFLFLYCEGTLPVLTHGAIQSR